MMSVDEKTFDIEYNPNNTKKDTNNEFIVPPSISTNNAEVLVNYEKQSDCKKNLEQKLLDEIIPSNDLY